ncbi:MAG: TolC family protein [Alphaproteobacteria bacterium]|nr:TolC family protein [Alphaproteobacteria bacterium]
MRFAPLALLLALFATSAVAAPDDAAASRPDPGDPTVPTLPLPAPTLALQTDPPLPGDPSTGWAGLGDPASAGPTLTLDEALALARAHHPLLAAAGVGVRAATSERAAAGRIGNPSFETEVLPGEGDNEVELAARLDLTDGVLAGLRVRVADARRDAEQSRAQATTVRVEAEVRIAYVSLQAASLRLAVGQRALEIQAVARDAAEALYASGGLPWAEVVPHVAAYERLRLSVAGLELDVAAARERLAASLGRFGAASEVAPLPDLPSDPGVPADLEARAVAASLELAALREEATALGRAATLARVSGALPEVEVGLLAVNDRLPLGLAAPQEPWRFGGSVELTVPLFAQGVAAGRAASLRRDELAWRLEAEAVQLRADARIAAARLHVAHAKAAHLRDVVLPRQREVTEATLRQYNAMQLSVFQLLQARRAEFDAELELVDALRDAWIARVGLDALAAGVRVDLPLTQTATPSAGATPDGGH